MPRQSRSGGRQDGDHTTGEAGGKNRDEVHGSFREGPGMVIPGLRGIRASKECQVWGRLRSRRRRMALARCERGYAGQTALTSKKHAEKTIKSVHVLPPFRAVSVGFFRIRWDSARMGIADLAVRGSVGAWVEGAWVKIGFASGQSSTCTSWWAGPVRGQGNWQVLWLSRQAPDGPRHGQIPDTGPVGRARTNWREPIAHVIIIAKC